MSTNQHFDYIITGAGCAGLSLAMRLIHHEKLITKRILLIDREEKTLNDRTWCFWEKEPGFFEPTVSKSWSALDFITPAASRRLDILPYRYNMIRSADFYAHCHNELSRRGQVTRLNCAVESVGSDKDGTFVIADGKTYRASYVFNSIVKEPLTMNGYIFLRQHFHGWIIKTSKDIWNPKVATLMDFRVSQQHGTTFIYVLPLAANRALIEYTSFTKDTLTADEYARSLRDYILNFITTEPYTIEEEERGVIPMTNYPFKTREGNVINIGTAGGHTKASTGYTFQFIQKATESIVESLAKTGALPINLKTSGARFDWYDSTLLRVLSSTPTKGAEVFARMFESGDAKTILRFLDNESEFSEELSIIGRMPKIRFLKAAMKEVASRFVR